MKKWVLFLFTLAIVCNVFAQQKPAYVLYNAAGKKVGYGKMLQSLLQNHVVLVGELHNNPIIHWLQLEITKDAQPKRNLVLGAEMFEHDNQTAQLFAGQALRQRCPTVEQLQNRLRTPC